jgi:hypothetical protein
MVCSRCIAFWSPMLIARFLVFRASVSSIKLFHFRFPSVLLLSALYCQP